MIPPVEVPEIRSKHSYRFLPRRFWSSLRITAGTIPRIPRSEEHTSELHSFPTRRSSDLDDPTGRSPRNQIEALVQISAEAFLEFAQNHGRNDPTNPEIGRAHV